MLNMVAKLCVLCGINGDVSIVPPLPYTSSDPNRRIESYVQLLQNALSSVSDTMGILVLQYACTTFYGIFSRWKY